LQSNAVITIAATILEISVGIATPAVPIRNPNTRIAFPVTLIAIVIGAVIAKRMLKKHFEKAGVMVEESIFIGDSIAHDVTGAQNIGMPVILYRPKENVNEIEWLQAEKGKCPVLALNGEKDIQVDATMNLTAIQQRISENGNKNVTVKAYPNLPGAEGLGELAKALYK